MKIKFAVHSVVVFGLFSLLGPIMRSVSRPVFVALHREEFVSLFWPAIVLSSGGSPDSSHDFWISLIVNVLVFALFGLIVGTVARGARATVVTYACVCIWLTLVEAWGSGFSLRYFSWSVLFTAFLLYWLAFWAVVSIRHRKSAELAV